MFSKICVFQDFMELNYNISSYAANENLFKNFLIFLFYAIVSPQPIKLIFPLIIQIWRRSNSVNLVQHSFLSSIYHHYSLAPHIKTVFIFHFRAACRHGNSLNSTTVNETHSLKCLLPVLQSSYPNLTVTDPQKRYTLIRRARKVTFHLAKLSFSLNLLSIHVFELCAQCTSWAGQI